MKRFAVSSYARKITREMDVMVFDAEHKVDIVKAASFEEALGCSHIEARKTWPIEEGWENHDVRLMEIKNIPIRTG